MVVFFQYLGEANETFGYRESRRQKLSKSIIYFLSHSAKCKDYTLIWKEPPPHYQGDVPVCFDQNRKYILQ